MTRTERLLRLARLRGDRLAIATLEGTRRLAIVGEKRYPTAYEMDRASGRWTEAELRAAWGDR